MLALRGVDLTVTEGELVVLLGPSGSGKSTLLNILGGLDRPTAGHAWFRDLDLANATDAAGHAVPALQRGLRVPVLQPDRQPDRAGERRAGHRGGRRPHAGARGAGAGGTVGTRRDHFPAQLSGGEQQRVAIARAIAKRPTVLLCDEPTGALDVATGVRVLEAWSRRTRSCGTTTLLITHNADIAQIGDRVVRFCRRHHPQRRGRTRTARSAGPALVTGRCCRWPSWIASCCAT